MEMWMLRHSRQLDIANEKAFEGTESLAVARWSLARTPETLESDQECVRIARLFEAQPEVLEAFVAPYPERNRLWISALIRCRPGPELIAMNDGQRIGRRLKDGFPWRTVERNAWEPWEDEFLYMPTVTLPTGNNRRRWRRPGNPIG